jgi:hypothetical protein
MPRILCACDGFTKRLVQRFDRRVCYAKGQANAANPHATTTEPIIGNNHRRLRVHARSVGPGLRPMA